MAPLLSPRLFKLFIAAAEDVRPLAMAFLAALKRKDEAEVRRLRSILDARLEKWIACSPMPTTTRRSARYSKGYEPGA